MVVIPIMNARTVTSSSIKATADIQAWTEQAAEALKSVNLSTTRQRGNPVRLSIPLDQNVAITSPKPTLYDNGRPKAPTQTEVHASYAKHTLIRRDSLDRREALLKGKEGSRQRRRWENDRLLSNPWAQPPLPSDWEVQPTYPRRSVPYYLAPLWDAAEFQRGVEEKIRGKARNQRSRHGRGYTSAAEEAASNVPKEVRARLKRARAAKGLLQDLEEEVRLFLHKWSEKGERRRDDELHNVDSEEEEIVFVGRNGIVYDSPGQKEEYQSDVGQEKMLFEGMADDKRAGFGRWLVHSLATYYGLQTWSITRGDPARREAYIGVGERRPCLAVEKPIDLPRPLWGMV